MSVSIGLTSCENDGPMMSINNPLYYRFERGGQSTVSFDGQTTRIAMATELIDAMKDFTATREELREMYANETTSGDNADPFANPDLNASSKSVRSKVAASKDFFSANATESAEIRADFESWIIAQVEEVFPYEGSLAAPGVPGQIADGSSVRYINGDGLEYDQVVSKGLIGALMVDQMLNNYLSERVLDEGDNRQFNDHGTVAEGKPYTTMEHKWDEAYGYLFGASADASDPLTTLGDDAFLNKYLSRVDGDPDFAGIASDVFDAFKLGRSAIVAGDYELRDEQANIIRSLISRVIAVRAVYYLQQGKNALPESGDSYGPAFHDLSEGVGFIYSLRFTRRANSNEPYFTRQEVDEMIEVLTVGNGLWGIDPETLDQLSEGIAEKFDFTVVQAAD